MTRNWDAEESCKTELRALIAAAQVNSIPLAEKAIDRLLNDAQTDQMKSGALNVLDIFLKPHWNTASGAQLDFINVIIDYVEKKRREIVESSPTNADPL